MSGGGLGQGSSGSGSYSPLQGLVGVQQQAPYGQVGWAPAFNQYPQTSATAGIQARYPQLYGGYYNQMTQMLAGPQYQGSAPAAAPANSNAGGAGAAVPGASSVAPTPNSPAWLYGLPGQGNTGGFQRGNFGSPNRAYSQ